MVTTTRTEPIEHIGVLYANIAKQIMRVMVPSALFLIVFISSRSNDVRLMLITIFSHLVWNLFLNLVIIYKQKGFQQTDINMFRAVVAFFVIIWMSYIGGKEAPVFLWASLLLLPIPFVFRTISQSAIAILLHVLGVVVGMRLNSIGLSRIFDKVCIMLIVGISNLFTAHFLITMRDVEERNARRCQLVIDEAEKAQFRSKCKSDFIGMLSHEIGNALHGILGSINLLMKDESCRKQIMSDVEANASLLSSLLSNTLNFARIESGELDTRLIPFDIRNVLENCCSIMSQAAKEKGLKLYSYIHPDIPDKVNGDDTRLAQVMINLISNAIKYTDQGHIYVSCIIEDNKLVIACKDTGIGISEQDIENKLFKPYSRCVEGSIFEEFQNTNGRQGFGLGLKICQNLVQLMQGEIGAKSVLNEGTTFLVTLPLHVVEDRKPIRTENIEVVLFSSDPVLQRIVEGYFSSVGVQNIVLVDDGLPKLNFIRRSIMIVADDRDDFDKIYHKYNRSNVKFVRLVTSTIPVDIRVHEVVRIPFRFSQLIDLLREEKLEAEPILPRTPIDEDEQNNETRQPERFAMLVVEDNAINRRILVSMLKRMGLTNVTVAVDGLEGFNRYVESVERNQPFDLILSDIMMPIKNGLEMTREIREYETRTKNTPVRIIAITANGQERDHILESGFNDVLNKPVNFDTFNHSILQLNW